MTPTDFAPRIDVVEEAEDIIAIQPLLNQPDDPSKMVFGRLLALGDMFEEDIPVNVLNVPVNVYRATGFPIGNLYR